MGVKEQVVAASVDWFLMKLPPWISEARREMWKEMIADVVYCALLSYDGLRESAPKVVRTFCAGCARPIQARKKCEGKLVRCKACGRHQRLGFGGN